MKLILYGHFGMKRVPDPFFIQDYTNVIQHTIDALLITCKRDMNMSRFCFLNTLFDIQETDKQSDKYKGPITLPPSLLPEVKIPNRS